MGDRQLSMRDWADAAYTLLVDSLRAPNEPIEAALNRASDLFLSPEELRRKQNREAFRKLKIPLRPPGPATGRVVPFQ